MGPARILRAQRHVSPLVLGAVMKHVLVSGHGLLTIDSFLRRPLFMTAIIATIFHDCSNSCGM